MSVTSGHWTRIGDNALGIGMKRYEDVDKKPLWRLYITRYCNDNLVEVDARVADLMEIKRFCDSAIKDLQTDGGRKPAEKDAA